MSSSNAQILYHLKLFSQLFEDSTSYLIWLLSSLMSKLSSYQNISINTPTLIGAGVTTVGTS